MRIGTEAENITGLRLDSCAYMLHANTIGYRTGHSHMLLCARGWNCKQLQIVWSRANFSFLHISWSNRPGIIWNVQSRPWQHMSIRYGRGLRIFKLWIWNLTFRVSPSSMTMGQIAALTVTNFRMLKSSILLEGTSMLRRPLKSVRQRVFPSAAT